MSDPFDLDRFVQAQDPVLPQVRLELAAGQKRTHWMWFVFPQMAGLGHSPMAQRYGLRSLVEAQAYLAHPLLGPRLIECTALVNQVIGRSIGEVFGSPDDMKFRSSMTLFAFANPGETLFRDALDRHFAGVVDPQTITLLRRSGDRDA